MSEMTRREFAASLAAAGAGIAGRAAEDDGRRVRVAQRPSPFEKGKTISVIGIGGVRLPLKDKGKLGSQIGPVDYEVGSRYVDYALEHGINFFDSAWKYHQGDSERFFGYALSKHPRESFTFCTKMSPWGIKTLADAKAMFAEQLKKCRMDSFDIYQLHSVNRPEDYERTFVKTGIIDYLREERSKGRIKRLGFSFHGRPDFLKELLDMGIWEAITILVNGKDWESANRSKELLAMISSRGIPAIGMESLCGGGLARLKTAAHKLLQTAEPGSTDASWSLRFAASAPGLVTALTGFTRFEHLEENVRTFDERVYRPFTPEQHRVYAKAIELEMGGVKGVPCSECAYCMPCPYGVDIPGTFHVWNSQVKWHGMPDSSDHKATRRFLESYRRRVPFLHDASRCIGCGDCGKRCPQWQFDIPTELAKIDEWVQAARRREFDMTE